MQTPKTPAKSQLSTETGSRPPSKAAQGDAIFRLLVDAVDEYAIFALSPEGTIMTWNQGAQRLKGYRADEVIGSSFSRFYTETDIQRNHPAYELNKASETGKYEEEGWRVKKDGSTFWANVVITALRDQSGNLIGFGKVTRDLTLKRKNELALRESEERFRLLVSNVTDYAIVTLDTDGHVTSWNAGAERIKGYRASEILGRHFSTFYPPADAKTDKPKTELKVARDDGRYEEEGWRIRKDGTAFWANVVLTPIRNERGDHVGFAKITRDLSERKKSEDNLRDANADLETKVAQRTEELSLAKSKAEAAVKTRDEFFSIASHELKTPLSSLKMQTQIRKRNISKGILKEFAPENLAKLIDDDERQVERLSFLVDNMLDISKLSSGAFELHTETLSMNELIDDVVYRLSPILSESQNSVTVKASKKIEGVWDRHRLEQVFSNLLTNAGKYAPGTAVEIEIESRPNDRIQVSIRDGGRGLSKADQARIFNPFERVKDNGQTTGLGLGLYIVSEIVRAHGGQIHVESEIGQGATFSIELPLNSKTGQVQ